MRFRVLAPALLLFLALTSVTVTPKTAGAAAQPIGTILVTGGQWAGPAASLGDLNVYSNGGILANAEPGPFGPQFQCTELAARWAAIRFNEPTVWNSDAAGWWSRGPKMPLPWVQHPNGGSDGPQFGDILVFASIPSDPTGHVAVVSGTGPGTVSIVEQNWTNTGRATMPIVGTTMAPRSGLPILGWLRASNAPANFTGPQQSAQLPLGRYYQNGMHWVTTNAVPTSWVGGNSGIEEQSLGSLNPYPDTSLQPVYSCQISTTHFLSLDSGCEGTANLGIDGYDSAVRTSNYTLQLWRCHVTNTNDHFVSLDPKCEGQTDESFLGYAIQTEPFIRYYGPGLGHWSATGSANGSYNVEQTLGVLDTGGGTGMHFLYSCKEPGYTFTFTSLDPGCEHQKYLGRDGAILSTQAKGTSPLYRCYVRGNGDHFDTFSSTCEGQGPPEGILGYL